MFENVKTVAGAALLSFPAVAAGAGHAAESADEANKGTESAQEILERFVEDYRTDPMAVDAQFGIEVAGEWWSVDVTRNQTPKQRGSLTDHTFGPHDVSLRKGPPKKPTWYFEIIDNGILEGFYKQELTAGTAAARSFGSESKPLNIKEMEGYSFDRQHVGPILHTMSHFFRRDVPEITYFERDSTMPSHGFGMVSIYNMKGNRIRWFSLAPEEAANEQEGLEFGQVPNLFIFTKGRGVADFGDGEVEVKEGMSVFVPPFVDHVFRNPYDEPLEGILVLFGANSDFAYGTSYLDFIEDFYEFYGDYPFQER